MPVFKLVQPLIVSVPPIYAWPAFFKQFILVLATTACLGAYMLLMGGTIGLVILLLQLVFQ